MIFSTFRITIATKYCVVNVLFLLAYIFFPIGNHLQRVKKALHTIAPAVINGGMTTFLGVILLCDSQSYFFIVFFKTFFLTVAFGLFHGLVFLPVLLAIEFPCFGACKKQQGQQAEQQDKSEMQENIEEHEQNQRDVAWG